MAFDFSTLVTDRTQADVAAGNAKGTYNAADLNRVAAALEDLVTRFRAAGYAVPGYQRIKIDHNATPVSRLPEGYTELAYIQSSGAQYVDTGFKPNNNTRVVMDSEFLATPSGNTSLFGARTAANSKNYAMLFIPPSFRSDYNNVYSQTWSVEAVTRRIYDKNKETTTIDGTAKSYTSSSFQADYTLLLFAINAAETAQWFASMRLYACQIYDNSKLVRNYIPCINADGAIGLYDLVNSQFYGNNGIGSFTAGDTVTWPEDPDVEKDQYTWYEEDVPTIGQMMQYLANVEQVREAVAVLSSTPKTPGDMALLTYLKANNIEQILIDLDFLFTNMTQAWFFSGDLYAGET